MYEKHQDIKAEQPTLEKTEIIKKMKGNLTLFP